MPFSVFSHFPIHSFQTTQEPLGAVIIYSFLIAFHRLLRQYTCSHFKSIFMITLLVEYFVGCSLCVCACMLRFVFVCLCVFPQLAWTLGPWQTIPWWCPSLRLAGGHLEPSQKNPWTVFSAQSQTRWSLMVSVEDQISVVVMKILAAVLRYYFKTSYRTNNLFFSHSFLVSESILSKLYKIPGLQFIPVLDTFLSTLNITSEFLMQCRHSNNNNKTFETVTPLFFLLTFLLILECPFHLLPYHFEKQNRIWHQYRAHG